MATTFPFNTGVGMGGVRTRVGVGGPKSAAGKARSAVNAVKHGLTSTNPVILEHETLEAWEAFRDAFAADLHPVGPVETELARDLALTQWRRRRLPLYEAQAANAHMATVEERIIRQSINGAEDDECRQLAAQACNEALLPAAATLDRILRYEAHLDRKFNTTFRQLERLQKARRQQEAENCKTNSAATNPPIPTAPSAPPAPSEPPAPALPSAPSAPSAPSVPSVLSVPSAPPAPNQNYKTNHGPSAAHPRDQRQR